MDHRPFEDWLLDNQPLTIDQKRQLNTHLQTCSSCTALAEVNLALKSVRLVAPAAGFADRFQVRLAARKQTLRRRNFWGFVILTLSVLVLLGWISSPVLKGPDPVASQLAGLLDFLIWSHSGPLSRRSSGLGWFYSKLFRASFPLISGR